MVVTGGNGAIGGVITLFYRSVIIMAPAEVVGKLH